MMNFTVTKSDDKYRLETELSNGIPMQPQSFDAIEDVFSRISRWFENNPRLRNANIKIRL